MGGGEDFFMGVIQIQHLLKLNETKTKLVLLQKNNSNTTLVKVK